MGYSYLLDTPAALANFRSKFSIPRDVDVAYCHESDMELHRGHGTAFFPLMSVLEGGVRFPVDPLLISTLTYYGLCPDQLPPNFYRVVSCVGQLNHTFNLQLDHHDINQMYSLCGSKSTNYYLKTRDARVRLISCLPDSNRNSAGEFVRVRGNWFAGEIPCPLTRREVDGKVFTQDLRAVHVKDLNFVLRSEIFVHWDGQLRASHLILGVEPVYSTWQSFKQSALAALDEEETASMRELVEQIDSHAEPEELEATSTPTVQELLDEAQPFSLIVQQEVPPPTQPPS
ncbi:uncharacterized protein LOC126689958 [Quercus robur]|uniref:uncharacterized protein LOC126689958 n=1 Tax=Quercus robur TaxID=38942 RepID=UPI002163EE3C|nr:uncharacterized protein LOC126689958 [Quercus robur]